MNTAFRKGFLFILLGAVLSFSPAAEAKPGMCRRIAYHAARWTVGWVVWKVEKGDPVTFKEGFLGVTPEEPPQKPWYLPQRIADLYAKTPGLIRHPLQTPLYFWAGIEGTLHAVIDKPLGFATQHTIGVRLRTGFVSKAAIIEGLFLLYNLGLDEAEVANLDKSAEENATELDDEIKRDFRLEAERLHLEKGADPAETRKHAVYKKATFQKFYQYLDKEYSGKSLETSDEELWPSIEALGVIPQDPPPEKWTAEERRKIIDTNLMYLPELRVLNDLTGVTPEGKLISTTDSPDVPKVMARIQDPDDQFTKNLIHLYQKGHEGKTIELGTLKYHLMKEAWIRAVEHGEMAFGRQPGATGLALRKQALGEIRGKLVPKK